MFVSETYVVEDCIFYDPATSNAKASAWTIPSEVTSTYSSDGWKVTASSYKQVKLTDKLTSNCSVEFTVQDYNKVSQGASVIVYQYTNGDTTPNQEIMMSGYGTRDAYVFGSSIGKNLVKEAVYRIEYTTSTVKVYENDTQIGSTASNSVGFPTRFEFHIGANSRYAIYKDIKVKPL